MLKTDFSKVTDLFLVYPEGFENHYSSLSPFIQKLVGIIPDSIHLFVIVNNSKAKNTICFKYPNKNMDVIIIDGFNEIWLRDMMGFNVGDKIIRPYYHPNYCSCQFSFLDLIELDNNIDDIIKETINKPIERMPIVMDGGSLVTNGNIGFITKKILEDNRGLDEEKVIRIIKEFLGIEPIVVDRYKHDKMGHTDGYMQFINDDLLLVSQYPDMAFLSEDNKYLKYLEDIALKNKMRIDLIYERPIDEMGCCVYGEDKKCMYGSRGIYVNYLALNNTVIIPEYTLPKSDKRDYNLINKEVFNQYFENVVSINCDELSKFSGVLHCISWVN
ncbi:agmatine deiminase family protein [Solitalea koreensis]|uniref:Agmatine/peptidylarginine deiminase n=1 Tax=Solitalea koreensis TaxID=543615 RepID=A0A521E963_9SPHI|nr:agmatine deiminase family protein [Solitalea koreensis]SMO79710.1 Agmatine/peptidylarginine deiminase [Solitalea koreensis]